MAAFTAFRSESARQEYLSAYDALVATSVVAVSHRDVHTSFGTTHVLSAGDPTKPTLVALHGKGASAASWVPHLEALTRTHHVVMLDAAGDFSRTVTTRALHKPAHVVEWLDAALDGLDIDRAAFIGASMGSFMAVTYALARPTRVSALALLCPAAVFRRMRPRWLVRGMRSMVIRPTREKVQTFFASTHQPSSRERLGTPPWQQLTDLFVVGPMSFTPAMRVVFPKAYKPAQLAGLTMPALVIIGENETLYDGPLAAGSARSSMPHAEVHVLANANHLVVVDRQDEVERLVGDFLESVA